MAGAAVASLGTAEAGMAPLAARMRATPPRTDGCNLHGHALFDWVVRQLGPRATADASAMQVPLLSGLL